jgi:hypothetical protein
VRHCTHRFTMVPSSRRRRPIAPSTHREFFSHVAEQGLSERCMRTE